jgi:pyruvate dehydrogenase E1 component beta subunit
VDYVTQVNEALRAELAKFEASVVYGQNINAGSRLGGLAAGMSDISGCRVLNTPNVENSLVGMGFGLMLSGTPSMFLMKQQDFVLLGVDHLVNTWNALRSRGPFVPFVIGMIVVDSGWEGPQSSFNNTSGLANLARIPAYFPTGAAEIPLAVTGAFKGGPAILAVSQQLFKQEPIVAGSNVDLSISDSYVVYGSEADSATALQLVILCSNFSLEYAWIVRESAMKRGYAVSVINYFRHEESLDNSIVDRCTSATRIVVFDDGKPGSRKGTSLNDALRVTFPEIPVVTMFRNDVERWGSPSADRLEVDVDAAIG